MPNFQKVSNFEFRNSSLQFKKGFTLIELLMVISIIAILTLLATYSYNNAQIRARDAKRKSDVKNIQKALQLYFEDNDGYPTTIDSTQIGTYINPIPSDPKTNSTYIYSPTGCTTNCTSYTLTACLENPNDPTKEAVTNSICSTPSSYAITNPS